MRDPQVLGDVKDKNLLIIDDICDGGGTFIQLAEKLKGLGAAKIGLFVTHGIFSKGYKDLNKWFDKIYSCDTYREKPDYCIEVADDSNKVTMFKI